MKPIKQLNRYFTQFIAFWHWIAIQFIDNRCMLRASSLTYTTLLAIVPLMVVVFSVLSMLPVFDNISGRLQNFVFTNFVPHTGKLVQHYLTTFGEQAAHLPVIGFVFLFVTAIMMMITIESNINDIWHLRSPRKLTTSLLLYWAMLTIGPILLGVSLAISSYMTSLHILKLDLSHFHWLTPLPYLCTIMGLGFLYMAVPRCEVKVWQAFLGALFAATVFEIAKAGFSFYVVHFPTYQFIYGTLATIPLFLIWIYVSWLIFLIGALIVNGLRLEQGQRHFAEQVPPFVLSFRVLGHLRKAFLEGRSMSMTQLLKAEPYCSTRELQYIIDQMLTVKLVHVTVDDDFILSADLHAVSLHDFYNMMQYFMPSSIVNDNREEVEAWQANLREILSTHNEQQTQLLSVSLEKIYETKPE
ncbi:MAG: YihY family inner membrane protein [Gammaproteobacteria bacterium]|nr:YihY family inner membrane protein [Gammaproteobacteria bacterium]